MGNASKRRSPRLQGGVHPRVASALLELTPQYHCHIKDDPIAHARSYCIGLMMDAKLNWRVPYAKSRPFISIEGILVERGSRGRA